MDRELWTKKDVARFLGRSISSVDHAVSTRTIPFFKISRHVRFDPDEIHIWVNSMAVAPLGSGK